MALAPMDDPRSHPSACSRAFAPTVQGMREPAEKRIAREELEQECMDISKLLDYAFGVLLDARTLWLEADPDQRQRLQRAIFPHGVEYTPASGFGTPPTSCRFDVLGLLREPEVAVAALRVSGLNPLIAWLRGVRQAAKLTA